MRLWEFIFQDNAHKIFHDSTIFEVFFLKGTFLKLLVTYLNSAYADWKTLSPESSQHNRSQDRVKEEGCVRFWQKYKK